MKKSLDEMMRVLKPNKYALIVIGNAAYKGQTLESVELIVKHANKIGLRLSKQHQQDHLWPLQRDAKGKSFNLQEG